MSTPISYPTDRFEFATRVVPPSVSRSVDHEALIGEIDQSKILSPREKAYYQAIVHCVDRFGTDHDEQLFQAAGSCFDLNLGLATRNIFLLRDFVKLMGENVGKTLGENEVIDSGYFAQGRMGFFILGKEIHFLKEGEQGSIILFDPKKDAWVESGTLPINGDEKIVVLNKERPSQAKAYSSVATPDGPIDGRFYHEEQELGKCVIHACHAFLGHPIIHENHFSLLKLELFARDQVEAEILRKNEVYGNYFVPRGIKEELIQRRKFDLAQSGLLQSEFGSNLFDITKLLKLLSAARLVENKYSNLFVHVIQVSNEEVQNLELTELLRQIDKTLDASRSVWEPLDLKISKMQQEGTDRIYHGTYMDALIQREPYETLKQRRNRIVETMAGLEALQHCLETSDRLIIGTTSKPMHAFTLRKDENQNWFLIDSLLPDQPLIENPYKWLIEKYGYNFQLISL